MNSESPPLFPVFISWSEADAAWLAVSPQLEGCIAHGDTQAEALENLNHAVEAWLLSAAELGWQVPVPMTDEQMDKSREERELQAKKEFEAAVNQMVGAIMNDLMPKMAEQVKAALRQQRQSARLSIKDSPRWSWQGAWENETEDELVGR